ncbi:MAG: histidine phosphatase family protein [Bacteroidota bacterium]|nr:histidine phosphatase family protein [Bacteroidota bacterium]
MKKLIIVRHCKSSWSDMRLSDFDRPLNNRGMNDGDLMSGKLLENLSSVDLLLSSSSNRTVLTSKFFIDKININKIKYEDELYHADYKTIINKLKKVDNIINKLMVIGHNPGLTYLVNYFSNIRLYNLPTTGIVIFDLFIDNWKEIDKIKDLNPSWIKFPKDYKL